MDGNYRFKNLVPILKDEENLRLLYKLRSQFELAIFLNERGIRLSIEEIDLLWDIIEVCKPSRDDLDGDKVRSQKVVRMEDFNVSGGTSIFYDKIQKLTKILE